MEFPQQQVERMRQILDKLNTGIYTNGYTIASVRSRVNEDFLNWRRQKLGPDARVLEDVPIQQQWYSNWCGYTAVSMALQYHGLNQSIPAKLASRLPCRESMKTVRFS